MKFGIDIQIHGPYSDPNLLLDLALDAERAGWEGFFLWDHLTGTGNGPEGTDPWIVLATIASYTERIRFGTMITPLARRRPWKVARETVAIDHLSKGRLILGVGLGALGKAEFAAFGEDDNAKIRAEKLDEGLALLAAFWSGETDQATVRAYRDAGVTWWLENINAGRGSVKQMRERIRGGPPKI